MNIIITGAAGFIGMHVSKKLLDDGHNVIAIDNLNTYYDQTLKQNRLNSLSGYKNFIFYEQDIADKNTIMGIFLEANAECVINLAAQAGVRYSLIDPDAYGSSNLVGFLNILEACRHNNVNNLSYASSSSVYGLNKELPFSTEHNVDHPISLYAASKKSNELMAHTYSHLYGIKTTGLRFFTVYGPWGRPDMALFKFVKAAVEGGAIDVYNKGDMVRDFTYIDDIVLGIIRVIDKPATGDREWKGDASSSSAPYKVYNIGNNNPVRLMDFIEEIEKKLGTKIKKNLMEMQPGDVPQTSACVEDLVNDMDYKPSTSISHGIGEFVDWYLDFYDEEKK